MNCQNALEFVENYYDHTWNNLVWLFGIAFGFIGVIMPIVFQWIQSKSNEKQIKLITSDLEKRINDKVKEVNTALDKKSDEFTKEFRVMENNIFFLQGNIYLTQGNMITQQNPTAVTEILYSFLYAAYCFLKAEQKESLQTVIKAIEGTIKQPDFPQSISAKASDLDAREILSMTIYLFEEKDNDGKYRPFIKALEEKIHFED